MPEVVKYDDLDSMLLLKNGNYLYKVPFRDGVACLKLYYGDRSWWQYVSKSIGNILVCNQTSFMPKGRLKTEHEVLGVWRDAGFRVFDVYEDVVVEGLPEGGYMFLEFVDRPKFVDYFADHDIPLAERLDTWRRFLPVWHRRHALAIERREPRLIHENGDLKHVMIMEDGEFLWFDFEMVFRSKSRVKEFVAREILAFLKSLGKTVGWDEWPIFIKETAQHYPDRSLLEYTHAFAFQNPNPILRLARSIDRNFRKGGKKPFSKYNAARKLLAELDQE